MPVHNWKGIDDGTFHDLHGAWIQELKKRLNSGLLPDQYYAMSEQRAKKIAPDISALEIDADGEDEAGGGTAVLAPPATALKKSFDVLAYVNRQNSLAIRHASGNKLVAIFEIVSRGNKAGKENFNDFMQKVHGCLKNGIHFSYVDVHQPGPLDPNGIHGELCVEIGDEPPEIDPGKFLSTAGYHAGDIVNGYVNPFGIGDTIPEIPLFLRRNFYVMLPLEETYMQSFASYSRYTRNLIELNSK